MRARVALLLCLAVAVARAGDPPAGAPDPIASARKDFAAIKSSSTPADSGPTLPSMDLKDLGPGPGGNPPVPTVLLPDGESTLDPGKKKEKEGTGNWLVDAMDKKPGKASSARGKDDPLRGDPDSPRDADRPGLPGEKEAEAAGEGRDKAAPKEPAEQVYNPLESFMGGWISARDHELLLPAAKADGPAGGDLARARAESLPGLDLGSGGAPAENLLPSIDPGAWGEAKAAANPYLAALDLEPAAPVRSFASPEAPGFSPLFLGDSPRGITNFGVDPRPADGNHPFVPDFALPADDDKYFKQMKRF